MTVLFLSDHTHLWLQDFFFLDEVFVGLIASNKNDIGVQVAEADLGSDWVTRVVTHGLASDASLLVHLPDIDHLVRLRAQRDEELIVLGAEGHRHEALVLLDLRRADDLAFLERLGVRFPFLVARAVVVDAVDGHDGRLVTLLGHGEGAAVLCDSHRSDAFGAFDAGVRLLGLIFEVIDHDVVTRWVDHLVVVKEEDIVSDISLQS